MSWIDAIRHEWLLQRRTLRFRAGIIAYLVLTPVAAVAVFLFVRPHASWPPGLGSYLVPTFDTQRFLTGLLAVAVAGNRLDPKSRAELWPVLAAAPMSNFGFLLRRTAAVVVLLLPVTMVPPTVATAITLVADQPIGDPWSPVVGWALFVVPVLLVVVALWTGLVLVAGGELAAVGLYFLGSWTIERLGAWVRDHGGPMVALHGDWLGIEDLVRTINLFGLLISRPGYSDFYGLFIAPDGPLDVAASIEWLLTRIGLSAGLAVLALLLAPRFLGRNRRDLRPLVLRPDHPLRNMLRAVHTFRQRQAADGALHHERWAALVGLLVFAGAVAGVAARGDHFLGWVERRYAAETAGESLPVTDPGTRIERWAVDGSFDRRGRFRTVHEGHVRHDGEAPARHLALLLDPFLDIESIAAEGRRLGVERAWDRLVLTFDPPLGPGESTRLDLELAGVPADPWFEMYGWNANDSFAHKVRAMRQKAWPTRRNDLSISRLDPAVDRRRTEIDVGDLVPAPRYTSWALSPPPEGQVSKGLRVPPESFLPTTELTIELRMPRDWLVADVCGHVSEAGHLSGRCLTPLMRYAVEGGLLERLETPGGVGVAALPEHLDAVRGHLETFDEVVRLSGEAWPGVPPIERLAVIERLPAFHPANLRGWGGRGLRRDPRPDARGQLLRIPEGLLVSGRPLRTERIVNEMLVASVTGRRLYDRDQAHLLEVVFEALMARRMGIAPAAGAAVSETPFNRFVLRMPIAKASSYHDYVLDARLPAVIAALEGRLGRRHLFAAAEDFLAADTDQRGTMRELFDAFEARSGVDLDRFYTDHFETGVLPDLRFDAVRVERLAGERFRVHGVLRNQGTGEVECPVEARAEAQSIGTRVRVGEKSETPFELVLDREPHTLVLDPAISCYRLRTRLSDKVERLVLGKPS